MPLRTYEEARPFARAIKERVVTRRMPPWPADRTVGSFANDPSLTDEEIATIPNGWRRRAARRSAEMPSLPRSPKAGSSGSRI